MGELLTVAVCTYNRSSRLPLLVRELRQQECSASFDILVVNNNSSDETEEILKKLVNESGPKLRYVNEARQGIVFARNRAIEECNNSNYLLFIDDDEVPRDGLLQAALDCFEKGYECVGGRVSVRFQDAIRPAWLKDELLGFLAEVDYGRQPLEIIDETRPLWTANIAYKTELFRDGLRFNQQYNREGSGVGGGEDVIMFRDLLSKGTRILYCPDMVVDHYVESWRLKRSYFLKLHYVSGYRVGLYELGDFERTILGVPRFLFSSAFRKCAESLLMYVLNRPGKLRQAMNGAYELGMIAGQFARSRNAASVD